MKKINVAIAICTGFTILPAYAPDPTESFFEAIQSGNIAQVLFAGANVNTPDRYSLTPLRMAVFYCHEPIARLLIERGANVNTAAMDGYAPLHTASEHGNAEIIELLLQANADIFARDREEKTPFELAKDERIKNIFRNYIKNNIHNHIKNKMMKRRFTAFSMARYPHLGAESPANILPPEIFYYVYKNFLKPSLHK